MQAYKLGVICAVLLFHNSGMSQTVNGCDAVCMVVVAEKNAAMSRAIAGQEVWRKQWVYEQAMQGALFVMLPDGSVYSHETREIRPSKIKPTNQAKKKSQEIIAKWKIVEDSAYRLNSQGILAFRHYPCEWDCAGHKAGYLWAENNHIEDYEYCQGSSRQFVEGCYIYVADKRLDVIPPAQQ